MGQTIEINRTNVVGNVLMIDSDRTLAGQDGVAFSGVEAARRRTEAARPAAAFPARLAVRVFEADDAVDHVHVMSNVVSVRRPGGWEQEAIAKMVGVVSAFFRFYPD